MKIKYIHKSVDMPSIIDFHQENKSSTTAIAIKAGGLLATSRACLVAAGNSQNSQNETKGHPSSSELA